MDETPLEGLEPTDVEPGDTGELDIEGEQVEAVEPPPRQYVEVDDPDNRFVRVKVNGEDVEVPFSEAVQGYSRTADYTQKTQEAAQLRQQAEYGLRLQQALETNPEMAMRILQAQYGNIGGQEPQAPQAPVKPEFDDPLEEQNWELRQQYQQLQARIEQAETDRAVERAVSNLQSTYRLDNDDVAAVLQTAYNMNLGVEAFPQIWKSIAYDRLEARVRAQQAAQQQQEQTTQQRQSAAAAATRTIAPTTSGGNGLTQVEDVSNQHMTPREAVERALETLGF
jgi:hypothetical protein